MADLTDKLAAFSERSKRSNRDSGHGCGYGIGNGFGNGNGYGGDGEGFGFGDGPGNVDGCGFGSGDVDGGGFGNGDVDGGGFCNGKGYGHGCGYGIKKYNGKPVYGIDGVETVLTSVRGDVAKGAILCRDLTTEPCYVVRQDGYFAHGKTLRDAMFALREKLFEDMSEAERIKAFIAEHKPGVEYPCRDLYAWHHNLTGSCEMGRKAFAAEHGIDLDRDSMTVKEFIRLTRNSYGGDVIRKLETEWAEISNK